MASLSTILIFAMGFLDNFLNVCTFRVKRCAIEEYFNKVLEICRPCSDVCEPLHRPVCLKECKDFFMNEVFRTSTLFAGSSITTTTTPTQLPKALQHGAIEKRTDPTQHLLVVGLVIIALIGALIIIYLIFKKPTRSKLTPNQSKENMNDQNSIELQPLNRRNQTGNDQNSTEHQPLNPIPNRGENSTEFQPLKDSNRTDQTRDTTMNEEFCAKENISEVEGHSLYGLAYYEKENGYLKIERMEKGSRQPHSF